MKKDEEVESKEELEAELLKVRSEIQWREREWEEFNNKVVHRYFSAGIILALFMLFFVLFEGVGVIIWLTVSFFLIIAIENYFEKTKEGKRFKKASQELEELKKRKAELEKKLDALEDLEKSKKHKEKGS